jgi:hypothetical protein
MSESAQERLDALRAAAESEDWNTLGDLIGTWAEEQPDEPWLAAGKGVCDAAKGEAVSDDGKLALRSLDLRLGNQLAALDSIHGQDAAQARKHIVGELSCGGWDKSWLLALAWADPSVDTGTRYLVNSPHLAASCLTNDGQITSMAVRGSRMSADTLGHRANQIWDDTAKMNERMDIGMVQAVSVSAEDGGWVLATNGETAAFATALVATRGSVPEALARAKAVITLSEAPSG